MASRGLVGREIKRGPGGIRDIEFAVQLLQLVHGRHDSGIRIRSTLGALAELAGAGYVAAEDARRPGRRLPLPADGGAPPAARGGGTDPLSPRRRARPPPTGPGARVRGRRLGPGLHPVRRRPASMSTRRARDPRAPLLPPSSRGVRHRGRPRPDRDAGRGHRRRQGGYRRCVPDHVGRGGGPAPGGLRLLRRHAHACCGRRPRRWPHPQLAPHGPTAPAPPGLAVAVPRPRSRTPGVARPRHAPPPTGPARVHVPGIARGGPTPVPAPRIGPDPGRGHRSQPRAHRGHRRRRRARADAS